MEEHLTEKADQKDTKCNSCGAVLHYSPGTTLLTCEYCSAENTIEVKHAPVEELDFEKFLTDYLSNSSNSYEVSTIKCDGCGSETTFDPNIVADACAFCGSPLQVKSGSTCSLIKPKNLLPFKISQKEGFDEFRKWIKSLWFAPSDLKKFVTHLEKLKGLYIPYWTYDSATASYYTGMRGVNRTETYTTTVNGKTVTQTRTRTDWYPAAGYVDHHFDDVLVVASESLPKDYVDHLEPWDLENLVGFDEKFLSGFVAESYKVDLKNGFETAKGKMDVVIRQLVREHIGGDKQQILTLDTTHSSVTFKHILLPIWLSAFRYRGKTYRFMINGRTGEVQGERPYSFWKIFFFVITIIAVIGLIIYLVKMNQN